MSVKAEAYQEWNQAAVVDKLITGLPEVVRALACAAGEHRQNHHRFHRRRRCRGNAQDHGRSHQDCGADPRIV
jgi:hypothetical protein